MVERITPEEAAQSAKEKGTLGFSHRPFPGQISDPASGKIPYQPSGLAKKAEYEKREFVDDPFGYRGCRLIGVPGQMYIVGSRHLVQTAEYLAIANEERGDRVVPLDARPHIGTDIKLWMGDSVGHWEGDILVIETTNHNGRPWIARSGDFTTEQLRVVERLELVNDDTINYTATITDPSLYTRPWTMAFPMRRLKPGVVSSFGGVPVPPAGYEFIEFACREGDYDPQTGSPNAGNDTAR